MTVNVIVLNGGSSSGKSTVARSLQAALPEPWLVAAIDTLVEMMPPALQTADDGIVFGADGGVTIGSEFRALEAAWMAGVAAMARAGAHVVVDDIFLGGAASQQRWRAALSGLSVWWVGVRCEPAVAAARELARGDRVPGMAAAQAEIVHQGVVYDQVVDTTDTEALACAREIVRRMG